MRAGFVVFHLKKLVMCAGSVVMRARIVVMCAGLVVMCAGLVAMCAGFVAMCAEKLVRRAAVAVMRTLPAVSPTAAPEAPVTSRMVRLAERPSSFPAHVVRRPASVWRPSERELPAAAALPGGARRNRAGVGATLVVALGLATGPPRPPAPRRTRGFVAVVLLLAAALRKLPVAWPQWSRAVAACGIGAMAAF